MLRLERHSYVLPMRHHAPFVAINNKVV
jgi:hypothetical protein